MSVGWCQRNRQQLKELGLKVVKLEDNQKLQEAVLSVHHALIHTLTSTGAFKIIENHNGVATIQLAQQIVVAAPGPRQGVVPTQNQAEDA